MYGDEKETTCRPIPGADLKVQLEQAIQKIGGEYHAAEVMELAEGEEITETLAASIRQPSCQTSGKKIRFKIPSPQTQM